MTPKFMKEADLTEFGQPKVPSLKLCTMNESGHLQLPKPVREKWLQDPVRSYQAKRALCFVV